MKTEKEHFCSPACEEAMKPCDLCLAQRRKLESDKNLQEGKPTLKYRPFEGLTPSTPWPGSNPNKSNPARRP